MNRFLTQYLSKTTALLEMIAEQEQTHMLSAAGLVAEAYAAHRKIYIFGCTHSAILAQDVFYRAGSPCFWQPLWGPGMSIDTTPGILTSALERNEQLGNAIIESSQLQKGDVLFVISTSGKNACPVAVAASALKRKARVVVITSGAYAGKCGNHSTIPSLGSLSGSALVIDNHVPEGDASVIQAGNTPMGPLSTIAGSFILHTVGAFAVELLYEKGIHADVFMSSNTSDGAVRNAAIMNDAQNKHKFMLP